MDVKFQFAKPEYEAYFRIITNTPKTAKKIKINLRKPYGSFFQSKIKTSSIPITQSSGVILDIPIFRDIKYQRYFLYYTYQDHLELNRYLHARFLTRFNEYTVQGRMFGQSTKDIINSFISYLKMKNDRKFFDKLTKIDYRNRKSALIFYQNAQYHYEP